MEILTSLFIVPDSQLKHYLDRNWEQRFCSNRLPKLLCALASGVVA